MVYYEWGYYIENPSNEAKIFRVTHFLAFWVFHLKHQVDLEKQKHLEICAKISWSICYSQYPQILMEVGYHSFGEEKLKKS
jgi:hypothetical protein